MTSAMAKRDSETEHVHSKRVARMDRWVGEIAAAMCVALALPAGATDERAPMAIAGASYLAAEALEIERTRRMQG